MFKMHSAGSLKNQLVPAARRGGGVEEDKMKSP